MSSTAASWAARIVAATGPGASAHRVDTDLTGEKVRSKSATAVLACREARATKPDSSRASLGARPCCLVNMRVATSVRIQAPLLDGDGGVPWQAPVPVVGGKLAGDLALNVHAMSYTGNRYGLSVGGGRLDTFCGRVADSRPGVCCGPGGAGRFEGRTRFPPTRRGLLC